MSRQRRASSTKTRGDRKESKRRDPDGTAPQLAWRIPSPASKRPLRSVCGLIRCVCFTAGCRGAWSMRMHFRPGPAASLQYIKPAMRTTSHCTALPLQEPHSASWSLGKHIAHITKWKYALSGRQAAATWHVRSQTEHMMPRCICVYAEATRCLSRSDSILFFFLHFHSNYPGSVAVGLFPSCSAGTGMSSSERLRVYEVHTARMTTPYPYERAHTPGNSAPYLGRHTHRAHDLALLLRHRGIERSNAKAAYRRRQDGLNIPSLYPAHLSITLGVSPFPDRMLRVRPLTSTRALCEVTEVS
ncbi:hypothetical protein M440DRAFT_1123213 [Trichoderma longibrachiatum ATCC 18648]|uniref:Uncharacterized protein n=1 Tax=Trichoderma longibrachiatum ATCC 18648 TaxID=983965 RepID=A0A2T4CFM6_TRILO|nr:hypothetical protein M440DRAFT_1123213 [Trichoderma longibrachiatum ATCC 18648]